MGAIIGFAPIFIELFIFDVFTDREIIGQTMVEYYGDCFPTYNYWIINLS